MSQVPARDAEAARRDLLDRAAPPVAVRVARVARRVLAALAGVGAAAHPVHGDGQRLVSLEADRAVGHGARGEAPEDRLDGLDVLERDRLWAELEREEPAQRRQVLVLRVDEVRVLLEDRVLLRARGVLELEDGVGIEEVVLAVAPPLVLAAPVELGLAHGPLREGVVVAQERLFRDHVDADAADAGRRPREVAVHEVLREPDRLEDLGARYDWMVEMPIFEMTLRTPLLSALM